MVEPLAWYCRPTGPLVIHLGVPADIVFVTFPGTVFVPVVRILATANGEVNKVEWVAGMAVVDLPLRVCSWMRSGTALLCSTLQRNFNDFPRSKCEEFVTARGKVSWGETDKRKYTIPYHYISLTHRNLDHACKAVTPKDILYIYRNPWDVMYSWWKYEKAYGNLALCVGANISQWMNHVTEYTEKCFSIRYSDLTNIDKFPTILESIRQRWNLSPKLPYKPVEQRVGWKSQEDRSPHRPKYDRDAKFQMISALEKDPFFAEYL